jgi:hypothetical protein
MSIEIWDSFDSPLIHSLKYDYKKLLLYVNFHKSKPIVYQNITPEIWVDFKEADSIDDFYNLSIKDDFDSL